MHDQQFRNKAVTILMVKILEFKDRKGRLVYLTDERYNHIKKHPEMQNSLSMIEEAIKNPQKITAYTLDPDIKYYYRYYKSRKSKAKYLRVILKFLDGEGFIITAYFVVSVT